MTTLLPAVVLAASLVVTPPASTPGRVADPDPGIVISVMPLETLSRPEAVASLRSGG